MIVHSRPLRLFRQNAINGAAGQQSQRFGERAIKGD